MRVFSGHAEEEGDQRGDEGSSGREADDHVHLDLVPQDLVAGDGAQLLEMVPGRVAEVPVG